MYIGDYLGDESANSWMFGGGYAYQFSDYLGASTIYTYHRIRPISNSQLANNFRSRDAHIITFAGILSNPLVLKVGKHGLSCDIFLNLGVGPGYFNAYWEPVGTVGGGLRAYISKWVAIRFDVNTYIHPLRSGNTERVNADMGVMGGISILFPTRRKPSAGDECPNECAK